VHDSLDVLRRSREIASLAIGDNDQEVLLSPTAYESCRSQRVLHILDNHMENGLGCLAAMGGTELVHLIDPDVQNAEWKLEFRKKSNVFSQVRLDELMS